MELKLISSLFAPQIGYEIVSRPRKIYSHGDGEFCWFEGLVGMRFASFIWLFIGCFVSRPAELVVLKKSAMIWPSRVI